MRRSRLLTPALLLLIAALAGLGWALGQGEAPPALAPLLGEAPSPTRARPTRPPVTVTPRLPGNATARATPTPRPTAEDLAPLPTIPPPAPVSDEPLPPLVFARAGQLWRSDGSGAPPRQLTDLPATAAPSHPAIDPASGRIAFVALIQPPITATLPLPSSRLYVIGADGGDMREVWAPPEGILWLPAWAPGGDAIYVHANGTMAADGDGSLSRLQIVRLDLASGERRTIVAGALDPTISPDGRTLAYLKFDDDGVTMHLEVSDLDGGGVRRVLEGGQFQGFYAPRFSPQGDRIVLAGIDGPPTDDRGVPLGQGGAWGALAALLAPPSAEAHGAPWDLWSVNLDGSGLRRLTTIYEDLPMAAFSPDGSAIALMGYGGIYLMGADGSNIRRIDAPGDHGGLAWAP